MTSVIISKAEEMNPKFRSTMEDCVVFQEGGSWGCLDSQLHFIGVYDGHGGTRVHHMFLFCNKNDYLCNV